MAEYIKREEAMHIAFKSPLFPDSLMEEIQAIPSADVAPVRHGRWVKNVRGDYSIVCSECGYGFPTDGYAWIGCNRRSDEREYCFQITDVKNYCPNCGAKMSLEE